MLQLQDIHKCTFLVELHLQRPYLPRGTDLETWEVKTLCLSLLPFSLSLSSNTKFQAYGILSTGSGSITLLGSGNVASQVPVILYPIPLAAEECVWFVQTA